MMHVPDIFIIAITAGFTAVVVMLVCVGILRRHGDKTHSECEFSDATKSLARAKRILSQVGEVAGADLDIQKMKEQL